jgi:hypothetical protein
LARFSAVERDPIATETFARAISVAVVKKISRAVFRGLLFARRVAD